MIHKLKEEVSYLREKKHQLKKEKDNLEKKLKEEKEAHNKVITERSRDYIREIRANHYMQDMQMEIRKLREEKDNLKERLFELLQEEKNKIIRSMSTYERNQKKDTR